MNKEYKLIQKYPSLPNDWEVGMVVGLGDRNFGYSPCAGNYSDKKIDNNEVEKNGNFWEIYVGSLEYKILSLEHFDLPLYYYSLFNDTYYPSSIRTNSNGKSLTKLLNSGWRIRQIERLDDGETFSLGDIVSLDKKWTDNDCKIKSFRINNNSIDFYIDNDGYFGWYGKCLNQELSSWSKVKMPLFKTLDGAEIFTGDEFYVVDAKFFKTHKTIGGHFTKDKPNYKRFKEQSNAEDYVIHNKPVLTLKEVQEVLNNFFSKGFGNPTIELDKALLNLIKEKLNLK
jgi:hypothetical protein